MSTPREVEPNPQRDAALALAARGLRVFPVAPSKDILHWKSQATRDPKDIRDVWNYAPNLNIGYVRNDGSTIFQPTSKLEWALALAAAGFRVHQLVPNGKKPVADGWQARATPRSSRNGGPRVLTATSASPPGAA
jgi:hypothetical protein